MKLATLERQVLETWEREREELERNIKSLKARINREEGEQLAGLSIDEAAAAAIRANGRAMSYFDLFPLLKVAVLSPDENPVSMWRKLRKSKLVMPCSGCHFTLPRAIAVGGNTSDSLPQSGASS